jgi:hypothetical protein
MSASSGMQRYSCRVLLYHVAWPDLDAIIWASASESEYKKKETDPIF